MYDEPTAGLDPVASTVVEDLVRSLHAPPAAGGNGARAGGLSAYIVVTHQHSTIRRAVDRLIFLHQAWLRSRLPSAWAPALQPRSLPRLPVSCTPSDCSSLLLP